MFAMTCSDNLSLLTGFWKYFRCPARSLQRCSTKTSYYSGNVAFNLPGREVPGCAVILIEHVSSCLYRKVSTLPPRKSDKPRPQVCCVLSTKAFVITRDAVRHDTIQCKRQCDCLAYLLRDWTRIDFRMRIVGHQSSSSVCEFVAVVILPHKADVRPSVMSQWARKGRLF